MRNGFSIPDCDFMKFDSAKFFSEKKKMNSEDIFLFSEKNFTLSRNGKMKRIMRFILRSTCLWKIYSHVPNG